MICDTCKAYECDIECNCNCHEESSYEWSKEESSPEERAAV
jgi:hypothetical protein